MVSITDDARHHVAKKQEAAEADKSDMEEGGTSKLMLIKLLVESVAGQYDGTNYAGWQVQKNAVSVQGHIDNIILTLT